MYGSEVTWRGQRFMQDGIQRAINRMSRASLGVLRSTPVAFLESFGRSMQAGLRLQLRQACYAGRVMSSESEVRDIAKGRGEFARRLRSSMLDSDGQDPPEIVATGERTSPPRGLRFPGQITIPVTTSGEEAKKERVSRAITYARSFESNTETFWTDGSALPGGAGAGAVVGFVEGYVETDPCKQKVEKKREGIVRSGRRVEKEGKRAKEKTHKGRARTFIRVGSERGIRAEAWSLKGGVTAFDAELSALVRGVELCCLQAYPGAAFNIFTDSQAVMTRLQDDRPGPGQQAAVRGILVAREAYRRGASITVNWVPGHAGVLGNEVADQWAVDAALRERRASRGSETVLAVATADRTVSRAFLKSTFRKRAVCAWREEIRRRSQGRRPYQVPTGEEIPRIPGVLQRTGKELASRFFQLVGHAMIAPHLKEKFGWVESDSCWWCSSGRQSREHLKECRTWREETRLLWKTAGEMSGGAKDRTGGAYKGRKGFMLGSSMGRVGPGNCSVGRLFGDPRFTEAVLKFLADTGWAKSRRGL